MSDVYKTPEADLQRNEENNSGNGPVDSYPDSVKGWSWGAFFLGWIWAVGNKVWIGLLCLIPYVGLIFIFVLGVKGRQWAWEKNKWDSVEHFNRVQKKWSFWGVIIVLGITGLGILAAIALPAYQDYIIRATLTGS